MTLNLTHTRMIIMKLIVFCGGQLMCHGELHPDCIGTGNDR